MNKQEALKRIEAQKETLIRLTGWAVYVYIEELIKSIDEPEKVVIPQFVADVIEGAREQSPELEDALHYTWGKGTKEFTEWYKKKSNRDLFARAWLDGYEAEEEKRYIVKMKGIDTNFNSLNHHRNENYWIFSSEDKNTLYQTHHTRQELEEAGFGWVFDCPGIKIEEVE